ncbi:MAG: hypothetical protein SGI92_23510 [Bryobacteraceae bacterium]|nr:hypothetical protein [Bryobacteraceae bacterium]
MDIASAMEFDEVVGGARVPVLVDFRAARFGVRSIPNFVVLREGQVSMQQAGLVPRAVMRSWVS